MSSKIGSITILLKCPENICMNYRQKSLRFGIWSARLSMAKFIPFQASVFISMSMSIVRCGAMRHEVHIKLGAAKNKRQQPFRVYLIRLNIFVFVDFHGKKLSVFSRQRTLVVNVYSLVTLFRASSIFCFRIRYRIYAVDISNYFSFIF